MNTDIRHIDCFDGLKTLASRSIDLVICDPPYGVTSRNEWDVPIDLQKLFCEIDRVAKDNCAVIFFGQGMFTAELMTGPWRKYWRYNLIWKKNTNHEDF
jgi:tRNA G10  N-methylase Trm11